MQLSKDLNHRPIIFLRFNPDAYTDCNGKKIKSCWKTNQQGILTVPKTRQAEWQERLSSLRDLIEYWTSTPIDKTVEIVELFY